MRTRRIAAAVMAAALLPVSASLFTSSGASAQSSDEIQDEIDERHAELEHVIEDYNAKREELDDANALIEEIEAQLPDLQTAAEAAQDRMADIAATAYAGGDMAMMNSVLAGDPTDFADRLMYLSNLTSAENAALQESLAQVEELEARQAELEALQEGADDILAEIEEQQDAIEAELDDLEDEYADAVHEEYQEQWGDYTGDSAVVAFAYDQLGDQYVYGADGPDTWDCSGLTQGAWAAAGVSLSHNTAMQWNETARISRDELQPGDLVFYNNLGHVGIYIGDGEIIHAPNSTTVVKIAPINTMSIDGYGRP